MKYLTLFAATFFTLTVIAQKNDPAAKTILDNVSSKFKTYQSVVATFTYKVENASGKLISTKKGDITIKGAKYNLKFGTQDIISNGSTSWNIDKTAKEVTINTIDNSSSALSPQKLFTNFYDKDFLYKLNSDIKIGSKQYHEIELTPKDKSKPFHKIIVYVDKVAKSIFSTKVFETKGNRYTYTINTFKPNASISESLFSYNKAKFPGYEEIDLR